MRIQNLRQQFREFLTLIGSNERLDKVTLWDQMIESSCPELYKELVWSVLSPDQRVHSKRSRILEAKNRWLSDEQEIFEAFDCFEAELRPILETLQKVFPTVPLDLRIYALPTAGVVNGRVGTLAGDEVVVFGLDTLVFRRDPVPILFSHEIFHVLHARQLGDSDRWDKEATLTFALWMDGLATYASEVLNPGQTDAQYLVDDRLASVPQTDMRWLARRFMEDCEVKPWIESGGPTYSKWFLFDAHLLRADLPARIGYSLALRTVRMISGDHSLQEMVTWSRTEADAAVREALIKISAAS